MANGNDPVQAYIAAMPSWKSQVGHLIDTLTERAVPGVSKAVKWNSPFYGLPGQGWFLSFHCYAKYVKVAFFNGSQLTPLPPVESKQQQVRYLHIHEAEPVNEAQFSEWVRQARKLPGWGGAYPCVKFVLLPDTPPDTAWHLADKLRQKLADTPVAALGGAVTASIGLACLPAGSVLALDGLLRQADEALYEAKRQGRNRTVLAHAPPPTECHDAGDRYEPETA